MVEDAIQKKRLSATMSGEKTETLLRRLKLVTEDGVTRAAAIVFGKEEGPGYPMGSIRLARFRGITKQEFRDNRQFEANAIALLKHADKFLDDYIPIARAIAGFGCFEGVGRIRSSSVATARVKETGRQEKTCRQWEGQSYDLPPSGQIIAALLLNRANRATFAPIAPIATWITPQGTSQGPG